ncbi:unnamed protein product [[Actinomadura] parvosata subsp. kistnae]|uniref:Uncharacterized protein n=2 Tax=Nonomuraea TaxID=83681 RepID=A0A1V0A8U9_9ACTN|nr:hypothetical protein BKM31_38865 [Nonomuraea sp. ATCC 55076]SPL95286.1 unnamed protein product [Actinomadura parvosata subsp. kistnae]
MPDFDPKLTRKAVRRGLLRTTANVLAVLLALALVATIGSSLVQQRGDREQRMMDVLGTAFKLYNPAYNVSVGDCCETTPLSMSFQVTASPLRAVGGFWPDGGDTYTISQDFFGRVGRLPLGSTAATRLSISLFDVGGTQAPKDQVRKVLARLPAGLNALAVVEFATPLKEAELKEFLSRNKTCADKVVYERRTSSLPITWGDITWNRGGLAEGKQGCGVGLDSFRAWVRLLREHDGANLRSFDLSLARLRKAAAEGLAYAYVDQLASVEKLRELIEDPRVRTVRLADVTFDLDRP